MPVLQQWIEGEIISINANISTHCLTVLSCRLQNERSISGTTSIFWAWSVKTSLRFCQLCLLHSTAQNSTGTSTWLLLYSEFDASWWYYTLSVGSTQWILYLAPRYHFFIAFCYFSFLLLLRNKCLFVDFYCSDCVFCIAAYWIWKLKTCENISVRSSKLCHWVELQTVVDKSLFCCLLNI